MSFLDPYFIYVLLPVLFLMFGFLFIKKDGQEHYFSKEVMEKLKVNGDSLSLRTRNILFFISATLIVLAMAQPVIKDGVIEIKAKSSDIMIALDISDSMLAQDVYPSRLELAKQKALKFLKEIPDERVGVVAFAKNSYLVSPLSFDTQAVSFLLSQLDTSSITQKGTNLLSMLEVVANTKTSTDKKYLFILSDGGDKDDFTKEIKFAKENDIIVFILGMGTKKGAPIKLADGGFIKQNGAILISKLNEDISELAVSSGGVYIQNSTSQNDIMAMLSEISRVSEKKELKAQEIEKYIPLFYYPLSLALLLILIATSSLGRIRAMKTSNLMVLFIVVVLSSDVKAAIFDFMDLNEAKKAYEAGNYEKSANLYAKHAEETTNSHSYFNAGNAFYQQGKYKEAVKLYEKAVFQKKEYKANKFANLGNAHAKQGGQDNLEKAKKHYEQSLELVEDENIKKNLELVKERIKEKEKNKEETEDNDKKENKDGDEENTKPDDNGDIKKEDENGDEKLKDKDEDSQEKNSEYEKNKEKEENSKSGEEKEEEKENKDSKSDEEKQEEAKEQEEKGMNETKPQMSDEEEQKWLDKLNLNQKTYLYKLNKENQNEANINEKPW